MQIANKTQIANFGKLAQDQPRIVSLIAFYIQNGCMDFLGGFFMLLIWMSSMIK
jgi:hypothetical protein